MKPLTFFLLAAGLGILVHDVQAQPARTVAVPDSMEARVAACAACHQLKDIQTRDGYFPRIAGKPAGYLYNQLLNFRDGRRVYPPMTWMVSQLSDSYLREMAAHFAAIDAPYPPTVAVTTEAASLARGRELVINGDKARGVPACVACHGERLTGVAPAIPGLVGLPRDYLNAQFGAWKNGSRRAAEPDCMARITSRLSTEDINAAAAWLAAQPVPANSKPEAALQAALPIACGGVPGGAR